MTTCPKCAYTRKASDTAPDYECPKCGIVYAKYKRGAQAQFVRGSSVQDESSARSPLKMVVAAIVVVALAVGMWQWNESVARAEREAAMEMEARQKAEREAREAKRAAEAAELALRQKEEEQQAEVEGAVAAIEAQYQSWKDAARLAEGTAKTALVEPVGKLQELLGATEAMEVPPCLDKAKAALVGGMRIEVDGFVTFMQSEGDGAATPDRASFEGVERLFAEYESSKGECAE